MARSRPNINLAARQAPAPARMNEKMNVSLGKPVMAPFLVPVLHNSSPFCLNSTFLVNDEICKVTAMSFGSPHGAVLVDDVDNVNISEMGRAIGTHALFPKGASVVFVQVVDNENLKAKLWQLGEGEAEFSHEADGVAGITAMLLNKTDDDEVSVSMSDKNVHVAWNRSAEDVTLKIA